MATVLIVDDHPAFRLVLKTQIALLPVASRILEADNGVDTLALAKSERPDLIVLDLDMPRMGGLEAISRIRAIDPGLRILVVSAHDPAVFAPRVAELGACGYASKRLEIKELIRCVESVLAGYSVFPNASRNAGHAEVADAYQGKLNLLSNKEMVVTQMLAQGLSNKEIGDALFISNKTVSTHKTRIMNKLQINSLVELVDFARKSRISM